MPGFQTLRETVMGVVISVLGGGILLRQSLQLDLSDLSSNPSVLNGLGGVILAYGVWRVYRGIRNFFTEDQE